MPMGSDPTHPKITKEADDVEAHSFRHRALPESEDLRKVGGTPERTDEDDDDVEGHSRRFGA